MVNEKEFIPGKISGLIMELKFKNPGRNKILVFRDLESFLAQAEEHRRLGEAQDFENTPSSTYFTEYMTDDRNLTERQ